MNLQLLLLAAEGHKAPPLVDIDGTVFVQGGIFLFLMFVLHHLVFRPYLAMRKEQGEATAGAKIEAEKETASADERVADYEERLMEAKKGAALGRVEERAAGDAKAKEILGAARERAEAKIAKARSEMAKSAPAARLALRTRADDLAKAVAEKILDRQM